MKTTPQNKMITSSDEINKTQDVPVNKTLETPPKSAGKKMQTFSFPHQGKTVQAESYEEALEIINNKK